MPDSPWKIDLHLDVAALQHFDVTSLSEQITKAFPTLGSKRFDLYTILSELYSNALEHGLLHLNSELKHSITGMTQYYEERHNRLQALTQGFIHIQVTPGTPTPPKTQALLFSIEDSGPGFDHAPLLKASQTPGQTDKRLSGRGMTLVAFLCQSLQYLGNGNKVEAVYAWD